MLHSCLCGKPGLLAALVLAIGLSGVGLEPAAAVSPHDSPNIFDRGLSRPATQPDQLEPTPSGSQPLLITADELITSDNGNIITARGGVKVIQGSRSLLADELTYNRSLDSVIARAKPPGRVAMSFETGDTLYGSEIVTSTNLKNAIIQGFRLLMVDNSRLAANSAVHTEEGTNSRNEMRNMVFSPCALCSPDPSRPPVWQIKAERAMQDDRTHDFVYRNLRMEIKGIPIIWLPYLSHPDWTVKRRSGILAPQIGATSTLGLVAKLPYYGVIDDQSDLTIEPDYYSNLGEGFGLEYRRRYSSGNLRLAGSLVHKNDSVTTKRTAGYPDLQGNLSIEGNRALSPNWRAGISLDRISDISYYQQFQPEEIYRGKSSQFLTNNLESKLFLERFDRRDYSSIAAYSYQSLTQSRKSSEVPYAVPFIEDSRYIALNPTYGSLALNSSLLALRRPNEANTTRLSNEANYHLQAISDSGVEIVLNGSVRSDFFAVGHYFYTNPNPDSDAVDLQGLSTSDRFVNKTIYRIFPIMGLRFNYPLGLVSGKNSLYLSPSLQFVASPRGLNPDTIPNNDSQSFNLNEANLFALNRFPGLDRVSSGSRIDYAFSARFTGSDNLGVNGFLGQSYRLDRDFLYPVGSGADRQLSDFLGAISFDLFRALTLGYQIRLDNQNFKPSSQNLTANLVTKPLIFSATYIETTPRVHSESAILTSQSDGFLTPLTRSVYLTARFDLAQDWTGYSFWERDLAHHQDTRLGAGIRYRDECIGYQLSAERTNYSFGLVRPDTTIMFRVGFKYLGDWDYSRSNF
ncbi:MAG: LPS assembly protein LptD [Alphaproteobacteria bacterium]|nr:LPS assembly protein LptD [Alphaproteobacteria bacterium]